MKALWLPYVVTDLAVARRFYIDHLGLSEVDSWEHPDERGSVLRAAEGAVIELVERIQPGGARPPPLAFEVDGVSTVNAYARRLNGTPHRYPRGHYGFEVPGPAGATIMVWSEQR
jgi:catechol 2,3-dioxygenase-like lactoylglutathione lyase family enzyme